ncbi:hypothetical protein [Clostridium manihotivorum]|uniref:DUF2726 domain-containing protein n=1 Tax=Clostridium manihotivorum TaxID=2320868 RepID=A0A3R5UDX8_9CLOT|nr:hypothetical protein [Clostridium manihotivorum]QAA31174.1 hypothetical protein C1I91_05560 [Clostridium manihotivorum]
MPRKLTMEYVREYVEKFSDCILLSSIYKSNSTKMLFKCKCGNVFKKAFVKFKDSGQITCPKCATKRSPQCKPISNEVFLNRVHEQVSNEYSFLEPYINARTKIKVKHNICGYEYLVTPDKFLMQHRRCPKCNGCVWKTEDSFKKEILIKFNGEYELAGVYNGARTRTQLKHTTCGHIFEVSPDSFLRGLSACHKCNTSFGEKRIITFLENNGISYKHQYSFEGLKRHLFDFVLRNNNGNVLAIEFDGIQHFKPVKYFGGKDKLKIQNLRDKLKDDFCRINNIKLIRIPYWEANNIEIILKEVLQTFYLNDTLKSSLLSNTQN